MPCRKPEGRSFEESTHLSTKGQEQNNTRHVRGVFLLPLSVRNKRLGPAFRASVKLRWHCFHKGMAKIDCLVIFVSTSQGFVFFEPFVVNIRIRPLGSAIGFTPAPCGRSTVAPLFRRRPQPVDKPPAHQNRNQASPRRTRRARRVRQRNQELRTKNQEPRTRNRSSTTDFTDGHR